MGALHEKKTDFIIVGGRPNEYRFTVMLISRTKGPTRTPLRGTVVGFSRGPCAVSIGASSDRA